MASPIAKLYALLEYKVDFSGLKKFEQSLQRMQKQIDSNKGLVGSLGKARDVQSDFYKDMTRGLKRTKPQMEDLRRNLVRLREGLNQNILTDREYRDARRRTLDAINDLQERNFREEQRRQRAMQRMQGPYAGGKDPRQAGNHRFISAIHSDVGLTGLIGAFAAAQSVQSYQNIVGAQQGLAAAMGDVGAGAEEFEYLTETANRLGISLVQASDGYKNFAAATQGTELAGQQTRDIFESVSSYAKVLNLSADDFSGVMRALTQMVSKGKISAEELRGQ